MRYSDQRQTRRSRAAIASALLGIVAGVISLMS